MQNYCILVTRTATFHLGGDYFSLGWPLMHPQNTGHSSPTGNSMVLPPPAWPHLHMGMSFWRACHPTHTSVTLHAVMPMWAGWHILQNGVPSDTRQSIYSFFSKSYGGQTLEKQSSLQPYKWPVYISLTGEDIPVCVLYEGPRMKGPTVWYWSINITWLIFGLSMISIFRKHLAHFPDVSTIIRYPNPVAVQRKGGPLIRVLA